MNDNLSEYAHRLTGQPMFKLLDKVKQLERQGKDIVHFEIGDPDFDTPKTIKEACISAIEHNFTHYTSSSGIEPLKKAICEFTSKYYGFDTHKGHVVVAPGCNPLIYCIIRCLVNPGEKVAIMDPLFPTYESVLKFLNIEIVRIPEGESLENLTDVKMIVINSPNNPTGGILSKRFIEALAKFCQSKNIFLLSDEIYGLMTYDDVEFYSPALFDQCKEHTIVINGLSKSFAMSGWRLGYMIGPEWLAEKVALLLQTLVSCTTTFVQIAAVEALRYPPLEVGRYLHILQERRNVIVDGLNSLSGVSCVKPQGAFYVFPNIEKTGLTDKQFADKMLENGVALLPGSDFGPSGAGHVRLAYTTSILNIKKGIEKMREVLK